MKELPLLLFSGGIGWSEVVLILVVVFILFGAKKFPEVMRSLGKGVKEFKRTLDEEGGAEPGKPGEGGGEKPEEPAEKPGN